MPTQQPIETRKILGVRVDAVNYSQATRRVIAWARQGRSAYVCLGTVNHIMEARGSREFQSIVDEADMVTSDGMPLVWYLRSIGLPNATRVYGPDLTMNVLEAAEASGIAVGFYGGTEDVLRQLIEFVRIRFPRLHVAYAEAPPFRLPTRAEESATRDAVNAASVGILFVGLGSPKQDRWMHAQRGRINAVMLGVGAAFDFLSGSKPQAPRWMQRSGLEWLFRLATEPRRLWRRYLRQNPQFLLLAAAEIVRARRRTPVC
jgi:N-acetylglucosaminyldiphosphoundecaprenol N-acetyl-beta-D-mannosaminyltransferase